VVDVGDGATHSDPLLDKAVETLALSSDGAYVAAFCGARDKSMRLCVYDVARDSVRVVDGTRVVDELRPAFAWSRDSRTLYLSIGGTAAEGRVYGWRNVPGDSAVREILREGVHALVAE
jgi:hypothetical protein